MKCAGSDNDFEDAVECLDVFPTDTSVTFKNETSSGRRNRLANLRSRMRADFGLNLSNFGGSQTSCDDLSQSDCTSISSWGRRFLSECQNSPCSTSVVPDPPKAERTEKSFAPECPPPLLPSTAQVRGSVVPPPLPPRRTPPESANKETDEQKKFHLKSKSLDRGITLNNVGVAPTASHKSSSLNRGVPSNVLCEEEQRINNAQGVIHQLTMSVLSASRETNFSCRPAIPDVMGASEKCNMFDVNRLASVEENLNMSPVSVFPSATNSVAAANNDVETSKAKNHKRYASCVDDQSRRVVPAVFKECRSVSELHCSAEAKKSNHRHTTSIDPITRDVERRMSMKDRHSTLSSSISVEGSKERNSTASLQSGVTFARNLAKSYGNIAQGLIKGAYQKAKTIVVSRPRLEHTERDDDDVSESDAASSSVSIGTSEANSRLIAKGVEGLPVICRPRNVKKGPHNFGQLRVVQELNNEHTGAVWSLKFSVCGRLLATAGQDNLVRIWVLSNHVSYFAKMRDKYNQRARDNVDYEKIHLHMEKAGYSQFDDDESSLSSRKSPLDSNSIRSCSTQAQSNATGSSNGIPIFAPKPFCVYRGHTADILDLAWSPRNYFLLSSSMDNTVKLWNLTRSECLCCFQHTDFVTCISFMPKDDRYFISGSMDGKIRLWHIPEKKVAVWNEVDQVKYITAITFIRNRFVVVGTYDGRCFFYTVDQLKYHTVINVRSSRGKNARGHKVTSLAVHGDHLLVTSNDSRIRMYSIDNIELLSKFKGAQIERSQIRASFSPDGKHVICGSEDCYAYIWRVADVFTTYSLDNHLWERIRVHDFVVTAAVFAPKPGIVFQLLMDDKHQLSPVRSVAGSAPRSDNEKNTVGTSSQLHLNQQSVFAYASARASRVIHDLRGIRSPSASDGGGRKPLDSYGDVIVTADLNGSIKVMANPHNVVLGANNNVQTAQL